MLALIRIYHLALPLAAIGMASVLFVPPAFAQATTTRVSIAPDGMRGNDQSTGPSISANGRYVAFRSTASNLVPGDTNGAYDVFVRDTVAGVTERVSVASDGTQGNGDSDKSSISADGRYVAFRSWASNLVPGDTNGNSDVFVRGPLFGASSAFTAVDVTQCLRIVAGLSKASAAEAARFNVETGNASVTLDDAVSIARKVAGLEPNP